MAVLTITQDSFESVTALPGIVFIDCWATWCPPCRGFKPVFEKASNTYPDITFGSVNTEEEQVLAAQLGITSIPTIMAFREGVLVYARPGAMGAQDFDRLIDAVRALDMDQVRAELAKDETPAAA
ncbi:MAG: thioredoxin family protein [Propionibacteriaceae bacterium]|jgi:thioredoxin 1|nr:thioredoxin family protein [Propionibacteriaceae bacterium]